MLPLNRLTQGNEFFGDGRMDSDSSVELALRGAALQGHGETLNDFARIGADHMHAKYALCGLVHYQFHQNFLAAVCQLMAQ